MWPFSCVAFEKEYPCIPGQYLYILCESSFKKNLKVPMG
jgi:hypothetical protein